MRSRSRIVSSLESAYREAFDRARESGDREAMASLDFAFQKDQIELEVLLDIRELLAPAPPEEPVSTERKSLLDEGSALVEKAQALRRITRLR